MQKLITTNRIEAFSDGVLAIIVTLLVLEIHVPEISRGAAMSEYLWALVFLTPKFLSFALSFLVVAIYWVNHHHFFHSLRESDRALLWLNNHLLFWLCFVPFPTAFLGDHPTARVPVMLYGAVMTMAAFAFHLMSRHAYRAGLFHEHLSERDRRKRANRAVIGMSLYAASVLLALLHPYLSLLLFFVIPLIYFLPQRHELKTEET